MAKTGSFKKKGVATIVGVVLAIAIVLSVLAAFYMTNQLFSHNYQTAVSEAEQLDSQSSAERMHVTGDNRTAGNLLKIRVENTGGIPVTVIAFFVADMTTGEYFSPFTIDNLPPGCLTPCLPRTINPGEVQSALLEFQTNIPTYSNPTHNFTIKVLTNRGNIASGIFPPLPFGDGSGGSAVVSEYEMAVGYGALRLNFDSFRFMNPDAAPSFDGVDQTGRKILLTQGQLSIPGYPAFALPSSSRIIFAGNFTNRDNLGRAIYLNSFSYATPGAAPSSSSWYIVKNYDLNNGALTPMTVGDTIAMNLQNPTLLYFAVTDPGGSAVQSSPALTSTTWFSGVFITTSGKYSDGQAYGQTLPFIAANRISYTLSLDKYRGPAGTSFSVNGSSFISYPFETQIKAGLLLEDGTPVPLTCGGGPSSCIETSSGSLSGSFEIPTGLPANRHYAIYVTDGVINTAWVTFYVES